MKLLIIGDELKNRRMVSWGFASGAYEVRTANCRSAVEGLVASDVFQAACVDLKMKEDNGAAIVDSLRERLPQLPIIALAGSDEALPQGALKSRGVCAQVKSPFSIERLHAIIASHALKVPVGIERLVPPSTVPTPPVSTVVERPRVIANDEAARRAFDVALRAANSPAAILILGETGTGKSVLAQTIHRQSALRDRPFVTVSCPCLNRELLESELFGHVRGAFTGAVQETWGKVAAADGGTLFLDEIGDLPAALQPKLLRLLQEKQYERVGETTPRTANVRIIAATNHDLKSEAAAGRFREDLFYRLNVISVEMPPLRSRRADLIAAAEAFLDDICRQLGRVTPKFSADARQLFETYAWPGNLRELRNVVERAAILATGPQLEAKDFPSLTTQPVTLRCQLGARVSLQAIEEAHIQMVVANTPSLEEAARVLAIDKSTLYRKRKAMEGRGGSIVRELEPVAIGG